jgi:hypothetical protein
MVGFQKNDELMAILATEKAKKEKNANRRAEKEKAKKIKKGINPDQEDE